MTGRARSRGPVWLLPAAGAAGLTLVVVLVLRLVVGNDADSLSRRRVDLPAGTSSRLTGSGGSTGATTPDPGVTLAADGLGLVRFGQPADTVVPLLTRALGTPDEDGDQPCQGDPAVVSRWVRWADLSIRLTTAGFAGYIDGVHVPPGRAPFRFATARGLALGDPVDALHQAYGDTVPLRAATPGPGQPPAAVFRVTGRDGTLSGVVEGTGGSATVVSVFAGDLC
jgi:hypothetical protein